MLLSAADRRAHHRQRLRVRGPDARPALGGDPPAPAQPAQRLAAPANTPSTTARAGTFIFTFAPHNSPRRYIPLADNNPQHLPIPEQTVLAAADPHFWDHPGYTLDTVDPITIFTPPLPNNSFSISCFSTRSILPYQPPSVSGSWRHRITSRYGRTQVLEWYLNSIHFGRYAFGGERGS